MAWATAHGFTVFTHDLDFGTVLALTHADGPSVLQVRGRNPLPDSIGPIVVETVTRYASELASGALVVVEESRRRVRVLPL